MLKTYTQFIFEKENRDFSKKVNFILPGTTSETLTGTNSIYRELNEKCLNELYNTYHAKGDFVHDINVDIAMPSIYYGGSKPLALQLLKDQNIPEDTMYNTPEQQALSNCKSGFYKMFKDLPWLPNVVFDKEDVVKLTFPIIAKPDTAHSGSGIEIFETPEDLKNSESNFKNYSEAKDLDTEFRIMILKDNIVSIHERVSKLDHAIKDKEKDDYVQFVYVEQDLSKLSFIKELKPIIADIREKIQLGVWSVDLMIDKSGELWVAEINSASGMGVNKMVEFYIAVYEDFYNEKLPIEFKEDLESRYTIPANVINYNLNHEWIKKSKGAIDHTPFK